MKMPEDDSCVLKRKPHPALPVPLGNLQEICIITGALKKILLHRHKLRAVVDNPAVAVSPDLAEDAFYPHPDLYLFWIADDLGRHLGAFVKLDDRKDKRSRG